MKLIVTKAEVIYRPKHEGKAPRLYFWFDGETVIQQFLVGRRDTAKHLAVRPLLPKVLEDLGVRVESIRYSRKAGCGCGCSPGFILKDAVRDEENCQLSTQFDVFINVGVEDNVEDFDPAI